MAAPNMMHKKLKMCFLGFACQVLIWKGAAPNAHTNYMDLYGKLCCNEERRAQFTYREHRKSAAVQHSWHEHVCKACKHFTSPDSIEITPNFVKHHFLIDGPTITPVAFQLKSPAADQLFWMILFVCNHGDPKYPKAKISLCRSKSLDFQNASS